MMRKLELKMVICFSNLPDVSEPINMDIHTDEEAANTVDVYCGVNIAFEDSIWWKLPARIH